jgi:hypothetical protein
MAQGSASLSRFRQQQLIWNLDGSDTCLCQSCNASVMSVSNAVSTGQRSMYGRRASPMKGSRSAARMVEWFVRDIKACSHRVCVLDSGGYRPRRPATNLLECSAAHCAVCLVICVWNTAASTSSPATPGVMPLKCLVKSNMLSTVRAHRTRR